MVFTSVKLNDGFMIGRPNTFRPSFKMAAPQSLLTTPKPLGITSSGMTLTFSRKAKQTIIAKSAEVFFTQEFEPALNVNV